MSRRDPCLLPARTGEAERAGDDAVERYLVFVAARCRPNTVIATRSDLRAFFNVIEREPVEVTPADVLAFIAEQRRPRSGNVLRLDGESGLSARTIKRRLASVSGLFGYLVITGERSSNRVPRGLATRRRGRRGAMPLIRTPRTLPRVLAPIEVNALLGALRRWRDRAMLEAMAMGGLRACEVLGLRLEDLRPVERRVFIADGKGGHQRLVPVSARFFASVARYLDAERPADATTDRVFVVLKGPRRGQPLHLDGLEQGRTTQAVTSTFKASSGRRSAGVRASQRCESRAQTSRCATLPCVASDVFCQWHAADASWPAAPAARGLSPITVNGPLPVRAIGEYVGMASMEPEFWVDRAGEAVRFYASAFGATILHCVGEDDDIVAQLAVGDARFWVAPTSAEMRRFSPNAMGGTTGRTLLVVDDPDALTAQAVRAGATEASAVGEEHGWRVGRIVDPYGHEWEIGRPLGAWPPTG